MSKSKHVLLAGSDETPMGREWQEGGIWHTPKQTPATWYGSGNYKLCGCCGANYAENVDQFNSTFAQSDMYVWQNQAKTYNRGVLVGLNLPINEIKDVPGSVVEHIQCGDDVLSLRLRMEQVYGN